LIPDLKEMLDDFEQALEVKRTWYAWAVGRPQAKQSTRFTGRRTFTTSQKKDYVQGLIDDLKANLHSQEISGCLRVTAIYCFPWRKKDDQSVGWELMPQRPDADNLTKPLFDALGLACDFDDSIVVELRARKIRYVVPCIAVCVEEVTRKNLQKS